MATKRVEISFKVGGVLTDPTSVNLSDPTAAYGVKRDDTNAVIVAAGTAMTKASTGVYYYDFTEPALGLTYTAYLEVVYAGETYRFPRSLVGTTSEASAGYFPTVAAAREHAAAFTAMPGMTALLAKSDTELAALCLAATLDIDSAMPYQGVRYDSAQEREFPRYANSLGNARRMADYQQSPVGTWVSGIWDWDAEADVAVVPANVKLATLLQAASILTNPALRERLEAIRSGLAAQSIGSLCETYLAPASIPGGLTGLCDRAQKLMDRYRLRSGGLL